MQELLGLLQQGADLSRQLRRPLLRQLRLPRAQSHRKARPGRPPVSSDATPSLQIPAGWCLRGPDRRVLSPTALRSPSLFQTQTARRATHEENPPVDRLFGSRYASHKYITLSCHNSVRSDPATIMTAHPSSKITTTSHD